MDMYGDDEEEDRQEGVFFLDEELEEQEILPAATATTKFLYAGQDTDNEQLISSSPYRDEARWRASSVVEEALNIDDPALTKSMIEEFLSKEKVRGGDGNSLKDIMLDSLDSNILCRASCSPSGIAPSELRKIIETQCDYVFSEGEAQENERPATNISAPASAPAVIGSFGRTPTLNG